MPEKKPPAKKPAAKKPAAKKASMVEYDGKNKAAVKKLAGAMYLEHEDGSVQVDAVYVQPGDFVIKATDGTAHVLNRP